jgi:hypothetical protein
MKMLAIIVAFCAVCFVAYRTLIGGSTDSWRQRLTIIIDTPAGEVRGSSVVEITNTETMGPLVLMEARGVHTKVRGEAVAVEVTPGRWLFVLLGNSGGQGDASQLVHQVFDPGAGGPARDRSYARTMRALRALPLDAPAPVPPENYPMLVTFDDVAKPETVRLVDPTDLAAIFGTGVRLKGLTLEMTTERVTPGRAQGVLGWLCDHVINYRRLGGKTGAISDKKLANRLGPGNFDIGGCK